MNRVLKSLFSILCLFVAAYMANNASEARSCYRQLMNDRQVSEVNRQLILAHNATVKAKAYFEFVYDAMKQAEPDATNMDAIDPILPKLRKEYLNLATGAAIYAQNYGSEHLSVITMRTQMRQLQNAIKDEKSEIEQRSKFEYEIALTGEQSIRNSLGNCSPSHERNDLP
jgi:succinoglycan biosynthesis transport protein ExoP